MSIQTILEKAFANSSAYQQFQDLIGGTRARAWTIERYVILKQGDSVLDLGCGPGDLLRFLDLPANASYLGIDLSDKYLAKAWELQTPNIQFMRGDCTRFRHVAGGRKFDWVLCMGILHHLNNDECDSLFEDAKSVLAESGSVVCLEPTLHDKQSRLTRTVMRCDRGRYVRYWRDWENLFRSHFDNVSMNWLTGAFRIPYEKTVSVLRNPHE